MKKIFLVFLIFGINLFAQSSSSTGLSFLKFSFGARNAALGDAGTALSNDVTSLFYNPAKLPYTSNTEIMVMHNEWVQDVRSEVLGVSTFIGKVPLAFGFNITSADNIEIRQIASAEPISTFNAHYFFGSISSGFFITDSITAGASVKYLFESLYTDEAQGWGFDVALNYRSMIEGLELSAAVRNFGTMNALKVEKTKLPAELRIGPSYKFELSNFPLDITAGAEYLKFFDSKDNHLNFGAEFLYDNLLSLRGGYQTGFEARSYTLGLGLQWNKLSFDYAFVPFNSGLGTSNLLSLKIKF
ncbi:MAG TPA: PorV/PorQ family protein [Ignavibacteriaceae bacterium]|nr:PorV/PorQ family protein [Ignavibacteriaceae bacterium]